MYCDGLPRVDLQVNEFRGNRHSFLVDTGCSRCLVKLSSVRFPEQIQKENIVMTGMGGSIKVLGTIQATLFGKSIAFRVVNDLPIEVNGFLGSDFFEKFQTLIDYEFNILTFQNGSERISLQLYTNHENCFILNERCSSFQKIPTLITEDCVIESQEIAEGVFVASSVVTPKNGQILVKIVNTRDENIKINNFTPILNPIKNFEICNFSKNQLTPNRVDKLLEILNFETLNTEENSSVMSICKKYADVFHLDGDPYTNTNLYEQAIRLKPHEAPIYRKPYRIPESQKNEVDRQIQDMMEKGIIENATSEWSSPILLVPKKTDHQGNKKWRLVIDYRGLNEKIIDEKFPLANISEILDSLSGAVYFTTLDLSQGFYQLKIKEEDRPCTAFVTDKGQFQMCKLPMGLKISPSAFSRLMTIAMAGLNYKNCFVYLDDLIVFGRNMEEHTKNLTLVMERLRNVNLKLNPEKCIFMRKSVLYLGHEISEKGILPDSSKIEVVKTYPVPKNGDETKRFVAFANYYRKFIRNFATITAPLNRLSKKGVIFDWNEECQKSFETLKQQLISPITLDYPDFSENNTFILTTDASKIGLGAVLSNSNKRPIAFASRALNNAEKNYSTTEIELLAIVWAVKKYRPYLFGRHFEIFTDHRPLVYLFSQADPSSRLNKFRMTLMEYDFSISYLKGKDNAVADALSRISIKELSAITQQVENSKVLVVTRSKAKRAEENKDNEKDKPQKEKPHQGDGIDHSERPVICEVLKKETKIIELKALKTKYEKEEFDKISCIEKEALKCMKENNVRVLYSERNDTMYVVLPEAEALLDLDSTMQALVDLCTRNKKKSLTIFKNEENRQLIRSIKGVKRELKENDIKISIAQGVTKIEDEKMKRIILNDYHSLPTGGHSGCTRMYKNIRKTYFWKGLEKDVQDYVKRCDACQRYKHSKKAKEPMIITTTSTVALDKIFLDLIGPFPTKDEEEFTYALTMQCELTKYIVIAPLVNKEAKTVARAFVRHFVLVYGIPSEIASDCGKEFIAETFKETAKILKVKQIQSTAYHHESIGSLENTHKHAAAFLRAQIAKYGNSWYTWLPYWSFAFNTTEHTQTGYTPFELVFGRICVKPSNIVKSENTPLYNADDYKLELRHRLSQAWKDAKENLEKSKKKRKLTYDLTSTTTVYHPGDQILLKKENRQGKLDEIYIGPFEVVKSEDPNIEIKIRNRKQLVHKNRIKPYIFYLK
jgi:RNase H-like domain found in reverse transcriptase/Reverse transcriptase (RNA-dependent DNA polymerase)/Integrase zinc binding domain